MKGIVLCGGLGTRLSPLTKVTNKHLLPVYDKPMVFYPITTLANAGIDEILVVVGGPFAGDFIRILKNGREFGLKKLEYAYQETEGGIADALSLAEVFALGDSITVILGDNVTDAKIKDSVNEFKSGAKVFLKTVEDPQRYGVPIFNKNKIIKIEEKPKKPKSNYAVTGLYMYDKNCFEYIKRLKPSDRNELEISDLNNIYIKKNLLEWEELNGYWQDAGTFNSLFDANNYWKNKNEG